MTQPILLVIPVFNDWVVADLLLRELDRVLLAHHLEAQVLFVDDGSTVPLDEAMFAKGLAAISKVEILELRRNLGHQRAIAVALAFIESKRQNAAIVIMDGDGEDAPADVPRLLREFQRWGGRKIIFADRVRRSESLLFRLFYLLYRAGHKALTGYAVRVGNFSVVPSALLRRLVVISETWNHYAAAVFHAKLPYDTLPTKRGQRLHGKSHMNFSSLVVHGLSAISVYGDVVGVRLLTAAALMILVTSALVLTTVAVRLLTDLAVPGWATYTAGLLLVLLLQFVLMAFFLSFVLLNSRSNLSFLPIRDYMYFVESIREVFKR